MSDAVEKATYYFDPACPWTWRTSRWLVDVAGRHSFDVEYRAFELSNGADLDSVPEQFRGGATASRGFLRMVEKAHSDGRDDIVGAAYTAYGTAVFDKGERPSTELVRQVLLDHGGHGYVDALDDEALGPDVAAARSEAQQYSGDDTGSPVLVVNTSSGTRGFFGPVLAPTPEGADADRLWEAFVALAAVPQFFEIKGRRTASPMN